nr:tetratricopeptide repeat protein 31 isoform X1 [Pogona vitticeps]
MIMERLLASGGFEDEWEDEEDAEVYAQHAAFASMGLPCPDVDGEPCWYCEDEGYGYGDWEGSGEEEPEEEKERPPKAGPGTFCGLKKSFLCKPPAPGTSTQDDTPDHPLLLAMALPQKQQLTAEEAEENAEELVAEEERLKKKAQKKRMKKKRQKDRKRQEKRDQELKSKREAEASSPHSGEFQDEASMASALRSGLPGSEGNSSEASPGGSPSRGTEEEVEEELDLTSTFVSKARLKVSAKPLPPKKEKTVQPDRKEAEEKVKQEDPKSGLQMTPVEQSMVLAERGNESAKNGRYQEAVLLFTEAVKLNPREYRFFGNRSFCYERLQCYAEALQDARLALSLHPGWPKGLFRQGKALMGLKRYVEAARTFEDLLRLGDFRSDAAIQLKRCQVLHLLENGFHGSPSDWSPWAREAYLLLSGDQQSKQAAATTPTSSRSGSAWAGGHLASLTITSSGAKGTMPSAAQAPIRECFAVWVGNLTPRVTEEVLLRYFQPFGPIHSMRHLPRKFCAFINYTQQEAAEAAYATLQGVELEGSKLLLQLKHPVHATPPHTKVHASSQQPLRGEPLRSPPTSSACSWLHSLGHLP